MFYPSLAPKSYISGVLDLFLPLKNSGRALRSMAWTLMEEAQRSIRTRWKDGGEGRAELPLAIPAPVIIEPGRVAGDDNVMSLLCHIVFMKVRGFGLLSLVSSIVLLFILKADVSWAGNRYV